MGFKSELDNDARKKAREIFNNHRKRDRYSSRKDTVQVSILIDVLNQQIKDTSDISLFRLFQIIEACYIESHVDFYRDRLERTLYKKLKNLDQ